jgi:hypothetical protein
MPRFSGSLSSEQMWQVSLLLSNADKLPASHAQLSENVHLAAGLVLTFIFAMLV